ncbi:MAG TPA: hypothetical protein V6D17_14085 [Candidatus Obscuribacterales bacterium]
MWDKKGGDPSKGGDPRRDQRKFLDNHPARQGNIQRDKKVAPEHVQQQSNLNNDLQTAIAQQILVYHESESVTPSSDWMSRLKEDSVNFLAEQRGVQLQQIYREAAYKKGVEMLVDKIFQLLQRYAYEFNQVAAGTDLHVSGTISGDVTEVTRYNKLREVEETKTFFRARFSTRTYSLVIRGKDDAIEFYQIPVNRIMALSKTESEYKPMARLQVKITEQGMMWRMADSVPPVDSLDKLCMWLFTNLVEESKAAAKKEEEAAG